MIVGLRPALKLTLPPAQLALSDPGSDHWNTDDLILSLGGPDLSEQEEVGDRAWRHATGLVYAR